MKTYSIYSGGVKNGTIKTDDIHAFVRENYVAGSYKIDDKLKRIYFTGSLFDAIRDYTNKTKEPSSSI